MQTTIDLLSVSKLEILSDLSFISSLASTTYLNTLFSLTPHIQLIIFTIYLIYLIYELSLGNQTLTKTINTKTYILINIIKILLGLYIVLQIEQSANPPSKKLLDETKQQLEITRQQLEITKQQLKQFTKKQILLQ